MDAQPEIQAGGAARFDLPKTRANYVPLSPVSFIARAAAVHPDRLAVVQGAHRKGWGETFARCRRLASALAARGIGRGDVVAVMAPNVPALYEAHFGVPMLGAVLCAINVRLDAPSVAYVLRHSGARAVLADIDHATVIETALAALPAHGRPLIVGIAAAAGQRLGELDYEDLLREGDPDFPAALPGDEWDAIALNYTSGTTGHPKAVIYHHRGAYLNALGNALTFEVPRHPVYLWTLPMFHCNGWCFPWTVAALAGTNVCLRRVEPEAVFAALDAEAVTHLCGAPVVMGMLLNHPGAKPLTRRIRMVTGGAAPPAAVLEGMDRLGFDIAHGYGLTEVYGASTACDWNADWDALPNEERAARKARQGVPSVVQEAAAVVDPDGRPVPRDGTTMGELVLRGNAVMKGYHDDPAATEAAFRDGWFHTGDLAVWHPDGYAEIRDRAKDIVISGGENISSIEVEGVLYRHPAILEAAVVARPHPVWGEAPCAFVALRPDAAATETEIIAFCRDRLAHFKAPRSVVFGPLPKTSTGKMQKFVLRARARELAETP